MKLTTRGAFFVVLNLLFFKEMALANDEFPLKIVNARAFQLVEMTNDIQQYEHNGRIYEKCYHRTNNTGSPESYDIGIVAESNHPLSPKYLDKYSCVYMFEIKIPKSNIIHIIGLGRPWTQQELDNYLDSLR